MIRDQRKRAAGPRAGKRGAGRRGCRVGMGKREVPGVGGDREEGRLSSATAAQALEASPQGPAWEAPQPDLTPPSLLPQAPVPTRLHPVTAR